MPTIAIARSTMRSKIPPDSISAPARIKRLQAGLLDEVGRCEVHPKERNAGGDAAGLEGARLHRSPLRTRR